MSRSVRPRRGPGTPAAAMVGPKGSGTTPRRPGTATATSAHRSSWSARDPLRWWHETRADAWEATVGRPAARLLASHVLAASASVGGRVDVVDLGAGTARSLDSLTRLAIPVTSYLGIEQDASLVAASVRRTAGRPEAAVLHGRIQQLRRWPVSTPRLVLLTWVLSLVDDPERTLDLARQVAGPDGVVVVAAITAVDDHPTPLDAWIHHRWHVRPVDPTVLAVGARRLSVTLRGRAAVATIDGRDDLNTHAARAQWDTPRCP